MANFAEWRFVLPVELGVAGIGARGRERGTLRAKLVWLSILWLLLFLGLSLYYALVLPREMTATSEPLATAAASTLARAMAREIRHGGDETAVLPPESLDGEADALRAEAKRTGRRVYGNPVILNGRAWLPWAVPGAGGRLFGVNLDSLARVEGHGIGMDFAVLSAGGRILYDTPGRGVGGRVRSGRVQAALAGGRWPVFLGPTYFPLLGRTALGVLVPLPSISPRLFVIGALPVPRPPLFWPLVFLGVALAVGLYSARLAVFSLGRPLDRAFQAARAFAQGDLAARMPPESEPDFARLGEAFNLAAERVERDQELGRLLSRANESLARADGEDAVLRSLVATARELAQAVLAVVFVPGEDGFLYPRAADGEHLEYLRDLRISTGGEDPLGHGPGGTAFRRRESVECTVEPPYPAGLDFSPWREAALRYGFSLVLAIPLLYHHESLGVLDLFFCCRPSLSSWERQALATIAVTASASLRNLILREETLLALAAALELRDDETEAHARRVARYAERLAVAVGVEDPDELNRLRWGALLHDIGKIALPDDILRKPGSLSPAEWAVVRNHPETGYRLVSHLEFLGSARDIIRYHHEHFDGSGYPAGLRGKAIPLGARIFAVVDALDALTADRPYRRAVDCAEARSVILATDGHFDPDILRAFATVSPEEWEELRRGKTVRPVLLRDSAGRPG